MVNHYEVHVIFYDVENQIGENILHHFLYNRFFMKCSLNWHVSSIHSKLFTESFWDISQPYKLFISQHFRCDDFSFLSKLFIYLLLNHGYWWIAWHNPPLMPFQQLIIYQYPLIILILLKSFCFLRL